MRVQLFCDRIVRLPRMHQAQSELTQEHKRRAAIRIQNRHLPQKTSRSMYESNRTQHIQRKEDADDAGSSTNNQQDAADKFESHDDRCHELGGGHAHLSE